MSTPSVTPRAFHTLNEVARHTDLVTDVAWSPGGDLVASIGRDRKIVVHRISSKITVCEHTFPFPIMHLGFLTNDIIAICDFSSNLRTFAWERKEITQTIRLGGERAYAMSVSSAASSISLGYKSGAIEFIEYQNETLQQPFYGTSVSGAVWQLEWTAAGDSLYASSRNGVYVLNYQNMLLKEVFPGIGAFALSQMNDLLAVQQKDFSISIYKRSTRKRIASLEGNVGRVAKMQFTADGGYLLTQSNNGDLFIWSTRNWTLLSKTEEPKLYQRFPLSTAPNNPLMYLTTGAAQKNIIARELIDSDDIFARNVDSPQYKNAKVVIMGEAGVGKSALAYQLLGRGWRLTESTHARQISRLQRNFENGEYREIYLWDLAGQPNYHLIHQLHLDDTCVAIIMFDDQSERDAFARPRYWVRALSTAMVRSLIDPSSIRTFLVAGRVDRGDPLVSPEAIQKFIHEHGLSTYIRTSARTAYGVDDLRGAVLSAINWEELPSISSTRLFQEVQQLILDLQRENVFVLSMVDAYRDLVKSQTTATLTTEEFGACVALLESRGLVRRLNFNDSILFRPAFLDAYASAIVNQARVDPNGLGSIKENDVFNGRFLINDTERAPDSDTDRILRIATLEDLIRRQLAFREVTAEGTIIVFPSQFTRENPDLPAPDGIELRIQFNGPLQNVYSILAVRMHYAPRFNVTEIWKNGIVVRDKHDRRAGFQISDHADGRGEVALFFEIGIEPDFKANLIDFVRQNIFEFAAPGSIKSRSILRCNNESCMAEFTEPQMQGRRTRGFDTIVCSACGDVTRLSWPDEISTVSPPLRTTSTAISAAHARTEHEANISASTALIQAANVRSWLQEGNSESHVVVVFTDIVNSTMMNNELGDLEMDRIKDRHFSIIEKNIGKFRGRLIKNTGDGTLSIFKMPTYALRFAASIYEMPGEESIKIRIGIHIGRVIAKTDDVFGQTVNYAARVQSSITKHGVVLSHDVKRELDRLLGSNHRSFILSIVENVAMKGFDGPQTLWRLKSMQRDFVQSTRV
jgi:small GTP-binding protein